MAHGNIRWNEKELYCLNLKVNGKLLYYDGLRGVGALIVFVTHIALLFFPSISMSSVGLSLLL